MTVKDISAGGRASPAPPVLEELFAAHYSRLVGLAGLLGADDPEDVAQEAFARLHDRAETLRRPETAPAYLRATVCNLARNRRRHLRLARLRQPPPPEHAAAAEQLVVDRERHRELLGHVGRDHDVVGDHQQAETEPLDGAPPVAQPA
ncbi:sigma factor, partial [Actinomadura roseirufa]|uniref:sigma factor n=1 Tax=Actinomadura roseirufa TaxID=2094049 RepID=UPI0024158DF3